jgi:hypothetical protein
MIAALIAAWPGIDHGRDRRTTLLVRKEVRDIQTKRASRRAA